jgi:hypothetical protein
MFQARRNKLIQGKSKERAEKVPPQVYQQITTGKTYAQSISRTPTDYNVLTRQAKKKNTRFLFGKISKTGKRQKYNSP